MKLKLLSTLMLITLAVSSQQMLAQNFSHHDRDNNQFSMFQKLNLKDAQKDQISKLRLNHKMEMVDLKANLEKKKIEMMELKNNGSYTREQFISQVDVINQAENAIAISKANFQMDVYQLLDESQKTEWNKYSQFFGEQEVKRTMKQMKNMKIE